MEIVSENDLKEVAAKMHDSEFSDADFNFNSDEKKFVLRTHAVTMQGRFFQTRAPTQSGKCFRLELSNVAKYKTNLEKLKFGKSIAGVFNYIKIRNKGKKLTLISQDLYIKLELTQLAGRFDEIQPPDSDKEASKTRLNK